MADTPEKQNQPADRPRMSRGLRIVFFLSLALNLVVIGVVAGVVLRGGPDGRSSKHVRDVVAPYTAALDRDERREIGRRIYRNLREEGPRSDQRAKIRADYAEALSLLRAETFDEAAFVQLIERQTAHAARRQKHGQQELVAHLSTLTLAERRAYADRVAEALERYGRKRRP